MIRLSEGLDLAKVMAPLCVDLDQDPELSFAQCVLSVLCEPGDGLAGALSETVGPVALVEAVINRSPTAGAFASVPPDEIRSIEEAFRRNRQELWQDCLESWSPRVSQGAMLSMLDSFISINGRVYPHASEYYPEALNDLGSARPHVLWARGKGDFLRESLRVGLVGSRNSTPYGRRVAIDLVAEAVAHGIVTVSGGAFGIDATVHSATLEDDGDTIAIMAGGLDNLYPSGNQDLFSKMLQKSLFLAEVPPGVAPTKWRFLQRNRLIAALSKATIVVEAGARSGSLNTASHAMLLQRPVAAVPGPITSAGSQGANELLRSGAGMVQVLTSVSDLPYLCLNKFRTSAPEVGIGNLEVRVLDALGNEVLTEFELRRRSGLNKAELKIAIESLGELGLVVNLLGRFKKRHSLSPPEPEGTQILW